MRTYKLLRALLSIVVGGIVLSGIANATIIYVDDDGGGDYLTISEAVANAVDGDVIIVAPGTYVEEVIVDVSVTIAGSGVDQTFVLPANSNPGTGVDSQVTTQQKLGARRIKQFSDEYFELAESQGKKMSRYMAFDEPVLIHLEGRAYLIEP